MRTVTIVFGLLLAPLVLASAPAQAQAGGPTSVLIVAPGSTATALYHTDPEYQELSRLVGTESAPRERAQPAFARGEHDDGPSVTLTWLIHDARVWRTDRIYYEAVGGPWITTTLTGADFALDTYAGWHTASDSERLLSLLDELGVLDAAAAKEANPELAPRPATEPAAAVGDPAAGADGSRWWWAGGGLLTGVLLTAGAGGAVWVRRRPDPRPRQQLVDL